MTFFLKDDGAANTFTLLWIARPARGGLNTSPIGEACGLDITSTPVKAAVGDGFLGPDFGNFQLLGPFFNRVLMIFNAISTFRGS